MDKDLSFYLLIVQALIFVYFFSVNSTYTLFTFLSLRAIRRYTATITDHHIRTMLGGVLYKPISIIVPAYNEEKTIHTTVRSLLHLEFPEYEIVVVNDGSEDSTLQSLKEKFRLVRINRVVRVKLKHKPIKEIYVSLDHPNLIVVNKDNGGKADALNAGIDVASYPLICSIDADSVLEPEALLRATRLFAEDREVVATGGIVRVLNGCVVQDGKVIEIKAPKKSIECFQAVEYIRGFLSGRTAWSLMKSLLIISGAFGVFRKDIVQAIGGYRDTVGEDMDLVVRLHRHCRENKIPYKIIFVPDPICFTQVPTDLRSLLRQRNRWHRGLVDSLLHSRKMLLNPSYGVVGLCGFFYFTFVEALGPLVEFLGYLIFILLFIFGLLSGTFAFLFFVVAILWGMWINIGSVLIDDVLYKRYSSLRDLLKLCLYGALELLGYRQLITMERMIATFEFWRRDWGKQKRHRIEET